MKKKKIGRWIILALGIVLSTVLLTGDDGVINLYRLQRKTETMEDSLQGLHQRIDSLKTEIQRLTNDTAYIERLAREKLGMAKEGEKVYKFVQESD
ncbi:MAG: FtsB family cell division protein [Fibrobacterota bacterium]